MEKELIIIVMVILIAILAISVVWRSFSLFLKPVKIPGILKEDKQKQEDTYKQMIEKSKSDYKAFMEQQKTLH